jgi:hypothetical protein
LDRLSECVREVKAIKEKVYIPSTAVFGGTDFIEDKHRYGVEHSALVRQLLATVRNATSVLDDRLFIADALERHEIKKRWAKLEKIATRRGAFSPPSASEERFDSVEFDLAWEKLATDIRHIAIEDIG